MFYRTTKVHNRKTNSRKTLFYLQDCIICARKYEGALCAICRQGLLRRRAPFCVSCGIRLLSELQYCDQCRNNILNTVSNKKEYCYVYSIWQYNEVFRKLLYAYKNASNLFLVHFLVLELYACIGKYIASSTICIVPIPANPKKVRMRGFDQSKLLAKYFAKYLTQQVVKHVNVAYAPILYRNTFTREQKKLSAEDRVSNIEQAIRCNILFHYKKVVTASLIILVDDVFTTGATMNSAYRLLRKELIDKNMYHSGATNIIGISLARID